MKQETTPDKIKDDLCIKFRRYALKVGVLEATVSLMQAGVSASVADKLARGDYWSVPRHLLRKAILEAMNQPKAS